MRMGCARCHALCDELVHRRRREQTQLLTIAAEHIGVDERLRDALPPGGATARVRTRKTLAGDEILCPLEHHAHALQLVQPKAGKLARVPDAPGAFGADARHTQQHFKRRAVHIYRKKPVVLHGPVAFWVEVGVEALVGFIQNFVCLELVKPQQPISLIQPVLPQKRGFGVQRRQAGVLGYRDVGGVEHPLQAVLPVHALGEL